MPNGGSDCCGTCPFNAKNEGKAGYARTKSREPDVCTIRNLPITGAAFYTYCTNHPHHNPRLVRVPIGPVFVANGNESRRIWVPSPDTEEVRHALLRMLGEMHEVPVSEYPHGARLDDMVVWQLGELREPRAMADLERVSHFSPEASGTGPFASSRRETIALALGALEKIRIGLRSS